MNVVSEAINVVSLTAFKVVNAEEVPEPEEDREDVSILGTAIETPEATV